MPNLLLLDIENSYITAGVWGMYGVNLGPDQVLDGGHVLCAATKWLDKSTIHFKKNEGKKSDFLAWIHDQLSEADAVITYNGRKHDLPLLNREFLKAGMGPPAPYKHIDLLETAKKQFKFPCNKMAMLLKELRLDPKLDNEGFPLWIKCMAGEKKSWDLMRKYNIQDVRSMEQLYYKLLPWISSQANYSLFKGDARCTHCGSKHLQSRGYYNTLTAVYKRFWCTECGGWSRTRYTELDKEVRKNVLVPAV